MFIVLISFQIADGFRSFVEEQVHDGQVSYKAVLFREYLIILLCSEGGRMLGMYVDGRSREDFRFPELGGYPYLSAEEIHQTAVQLPQSERTAVQYPEEFILIIHEERGTAVGAAYGPFRLFHPIRGIIHLYFLHRQMEGAVLMNHRHIEGFLSGCPVKVTSVPVALFLVCLACLQINRRILREYGEVFYRWKVCCLQYQPTLCLPSHASHRHVRFLSWNCV